MYQGGEEPPSLVHLVLDTENEDTKMDFIIQLLVVRDHHSYNIHSNGVLLLGTDFGEG